MIELVTENGLLDVKLVGPPIATWHGWRRLCSRTRERDTQRNSDRDGAQIAVQAALSALSSDQITL